MSKYKCLLYSKEKGTGVVTINRPQSLNALSEEVYAELNELFQEIENDVSRYKNKISTLSKKKQLTSNLLVFQLKNEC